MAARERREQGARKKVIFGTSDDAHVATPTLTSHRKAHWTLPSSPSSPPSTATLPSTPPAPVAAASPSSPNLPTTPPPRTRRLAAGLGSTSPTTPPIPTPCCLCSSWPGRAEPVRLVRAGVSVRAAHLGSECRDLSSAQLLVSTTIACGFRESGITSKRFIVAIRCSIRMEVPLGDAREIEVPCEYVKFLVGVANEKMEANRRRTEKFRQALRRTLEFGGRSEWCW
ncbi:hypothetical protein NL676_014679 [Syzygium grande]|nr:hypothetical protein NL676_014679 [Syzygium grande]